MKPSFCNRTRREFMWQAGNGFFGTALAGVLAQDGLASGGLQTPMAVKQPHFPARAKACINLFMVGGPSHMDTFDPKPMLKERHGTDHDFKVDNSITQKPKGKLKGSPFAFKQHGEAGTWVSELYPHLATCVDDLAVIRSMKGDSSAHGSASLQMNTGFIRQGHPSVGSWATYGLGSVNQNLPGFVVLVAGAPYSGATNWNSGFMPASFAGTVFDIKNTPIANLRPATGATPAEQRRQLDFLGELNRLGQQRVSDRGELQARIDAYELAFRMQAHAPEAVDLNAESEKTLEAYGVGQQGTDKFARCCLMARRLVERGVRYVQIFHSNWDTHGDNDNRHRKLCHETDQPMAALVKDLKQRGLLDQTLVSWGGEFGRTPIGGPEAKGGRDHHATAFSMWMAGGGVQGGVNYGATDELGYDVAENPVHVHDLHATMLHLMGIHHEELTYRHNDRDFRLTDVAGQVVRELLV